MKKRRWFLFGLLGLVIVCAAGIVFFSPRPILADLDSVRSIRIVYNPNVNQKDGDFFELDEFDSDGVLACLSRYQEHRTLSRAKSYSRNDVELEITVISADDAKSILLGNLNYTSEGNGAFLFQIVDPDALLLELKNYITLP